MPCNYLFGSVARGKSTLHDVDLAVMVRDLSELEPLAKYGRQINRFFHGWDIFLFSADLSYLGRVCERKTCPGGSIECRRPGCGTPAHIKLVPEFTLDSRKLFEGPIEILWPPNRPYACQWGHH